MIEPNYRVRFLVKPLQALRVASKADGQQFERGFPPRNNVSGKIECPCRSNIISDREQDACNMQS